MNSNTPLGTMSGGKAPAGGGGGGGPAQPPSQVDGPAWSILNESAAGGASTNVNFDAFQNTVQGGIALGTTRTAELVVTNTSKKTALTVTQIAVQGTNASDFSVAPADIQSALNKSLAANKNLFDILRVSFTPTAPGARSATLHLVSNAGTASVALTGTGLPAQPIIDTASAFSFIPESAPINFTIMNDGGPPLILNSLSFRGTNPGSFQLAVANSGQSNCFAGMELGPHSYCFLAVGLAPGAPVPSSAIFAIRSNDPATPEKDITLTLTP